MYLGLGSNIGDREGSLASARRLLSSLPETELTAVSSLYLTAPVGGPEQAEYINQVLELHTGLAPRELLKAVQGIENELGRRREVRWGPRTIDIDILWYHGVSAADPDFEVPHPRLEERRFVLEPLAELIPDLILPSGRTVSQALVFVETQQVRRYSAGTAADTSGGAVGR